MLRSASTLGSVRWRGSGNAGGDAHARDQAVAAAAGTVRLGDVDMREPHADDDGDEDTLISEEEGWVTWLCGSGVKLGVLLRGELGVAFVAAAVALVAVVVGASCGDRCPLLSAPVSQWMLFAAYSIVIAIPGRLMDRALFSMLSATSQVVTFSFLLPVWFYTLSFEGTLARFWWLLMTWSATDAFLTLGATEAALVDAAYRSLVVFQLLATARNLALRMTMRTLLIGSFEGAINDVLFKNLVLLSVAKPHAVASDGRLALERDAAWRELRRLYTSADFRAKLDTISKLRFRLYNRVGDLVPISKREAVAPFAKLAFKHLVSIPPSALVEVERRGEEIPLGGPVDVGGVTASAAAAGAPPPRDGGRAGDDWRSQQPQRAEESFGDATGATPVATPASPTAPPLPGHVHPPPPASAGGRSRSGTAGLSAEAAVRAVTRLRGGLHDIVDAASRAMGGGGGGIRGGISGASRQTRSPSGGGGGGGGGGFDVPVHTADNGFERADAAAGDGALPRAHSFAATSSPTARPQSGRTASRALTSSTFVPPPPPPLVPHLPSADTTSGALHITINPAPGDGDAGQDGRGAPRDAVFAPLHSAANAASQLSDHPRPLLSRQSSARSRAAPAAATPIAEAAPGEEDDDESQSGGDEGRGHGDPFAQRGRVFSSRAHRLSTTSGAAGGDHDVADVGAHTAARLALPTRGAQVTVGWGGAARDTARSALTRADGVGSGGDIGGSAASRAPPRRSSSLPRSRKASDILAADVDAAAAAAAATAAPSATAAAATAAALAERAFHAKIVASLSRLRQEEGSGGAGDLLRDFSSPPAAGGNDDAGEAAGSAASSATSAPPAATLGGHFGSIGAHVGRLLRDAVRAGLEASIPAEELAEFHAGLAETARRQHAQQQQQQLQGSGDGGGRGGAAAAALRRGGARGGRAGTSGLRRSNSAGRAGGHGTPAGADTRGRYTAAAARQAGDRGRPAVAFVEHRGSGCGPAGAGGTGGTGGGGGGGGGDVAPPSAPPPREYPKLRLAHVAACLDTELLPDTAAPLLDPEKAFAVFDSNADGVVERAEFIAAAEGVYSDLRSLKASLSGHQSVSTAMQSLLDVAFWAVMSVAVLFIFNVPLVQVYVPVGTVLVSASFAIGNALSNIVSSLIFVLATRPFEVGDRITASGVYNGDEPLIVKRIDVLTTTFLRVVNKEVMVPNHMLLSMAIENHKRSPNAVMKIELQVSQLTTAAQLESLRRRVNAYLASQALAWKPNCMIRAGAMRDAGITLSLWAGSHYSWQDAPRLFRANFLLNLEVLAALRATGIAFRMPDQSVHVEGAVFGAAAAPAAAGPALPTLPAVPTATSGAGSANVVVPLVPAAVPPAAGAAANGVTPTGSSGGVVYLPVPVMMVGGGAWPAGALSPMAVQQQFAAWQAMTAAAAGGAGVQPATDGATV